MYTLRNATMDDALELYRWKTSDGVAETALSTAPITWESHLRWVAARVCLPGFLIIMGRGERCGWLRFDEGGEVAILIAPEWRGMGVGTAVLAGACRGRRGLYARIVDGNAPSMALFTRAGFRVAGMGEEGGRRYSLLVLD